MRHITKKIIKIIFILAACLCLWLAGHVSGIRYQQAKIKHPIGNGTAYLYELNGEKELTLDYLQEGQVVACIFLVDRGSMEAWIETESGALAASSVRFDADGSYLFSVPSAGNYIMKIAGKDASVHISTLTYDKAE